VAEIVVAFLQIRWPACQHTDVMQQGITAHGKQRDRCKHPSCPEPTFLVESSQQGRVPEVTQQMLAMTWKGRGIRDMARVLPSSPTPVMAAVKTSAAAPTRQRFGNPTPGSSREPC
jgi:transposase-like protein